MSLIKKNFKDYIYTTKSCPNSLKRFSAILVCEKKMKFTQTQTVTTRLPRVIEEFLNTRIFFALPLFPARASLS